MSKLIMGKVLVAICCCLGFSSAYAQSFTSSEALLNNTYTSGGVVGVADANMDGYDDIIIMNQSNNLFIEYQNPDGSFTDSYFTQVSSASQWGMAIGDLDNDGHLDVVSGNGSANYVNIDNPTTFTLSQLIDGGEFDFAQGMSMGDLNNDGWLDVFGCDDVDISDIWGNDGTGNFNDNDEWIDMNTVVPSDNSGNYGSTLTDYDCDGDLDLFIAKCRQGVSDPTDPRRLNTMYQNDGNNNFTEVAASIGLQPMEQSWTADFADIDNDGDFDCLLTNHSTTLLLYENDGSGFFTDITSGSGLEYTGFFLQAKMHDFDNDGYVDLIYSGGTHRYLRNNGDKTFTEISNMFPYGDTMHSFGIGDLNHDGFLDVYSSYGGGYVSPDSNNPDKLWLNDGGSNNWVQFKLVGYESNKSAVGAKVKITGAFGTQIREIRGGESYGITNTFSCHFGLGTNTSITTAEVLWPSGLVSPLGSPAINTFHEIHEIEGCTDDTACNFDPLASIDDGSCNFTNPCEGCMDLNACNYNDNAVIDDGSCTYPGCDNAVACNFDPNAGCDDGSCVFGGCMDASACNYNSSAACDDGSCVYGPANDACSNATPLSLGSNNITNAGECLDEGYAVPETGCNTTDGWCNDDGVTVSVWYSFTTPSNEVEITLETFFDGTGTWNDTQMAVYSDCGGTLIGANDDGGSDQWMSRLVFGCGELDANTTYTVLLDGYNGNSGTALLELSYESGPCGGEGCTDSNACNYDDTATSNDGSCVFPGCTDSGACNYDATAGCEDNSCEYNSCLGCTISGSCNYDPSATIDDGSCTVPGCDNSFACNYDPNAGCDDGSCLLPGCNDTFACNYDLTAGCDDGSCVYPGCNDSNACNFNPAAGCNDFSCTYPGCTSTIACNYDPNAGCDDGSCDFTSCQGCMDSNACNFDSTATMDDGSCSYPGCIDPLACNYNIAAGCDDGSCEYTSCIGGCPGDANGDLLVNVLDLVAVSSNFGCTSDCVSGDADGNDLVNILDLVAVSSNFGSDCNP